MQSGEPELSIWLTRMCIGAAAARPPERTRRASHGAIPAVPDVNSFNATPSMTWRRVAAPTSRWLTHTRPKSAAQNTADREQHHPTRRASYFFCGVAQGVVMHERQLQHLRQRQSLGVIANLASGCGHSRAGEVRGNGIRLVDADFFFLCSLVCVSSY